jgi:hypothetical protein
VRRQIPGSGPASWHDHFVPPRHLSRAAFGALVFAGAAALAVAGLPAAGQSVGLHALTRRLAAATVPTARVNEPVAALLAGPGTPDPSPVPSPSSPSPSAAPDPDAPTAADGDAGILRRTVAPTGNGQFDVVPGSVAAPGPGTVRIVRVEVERGLPVDGGRFAAFVLTTLNDGRGWGHGGAMSFARTDGDAPITVVLASPRTSAGLCEALRTDGTLSCRNGPRAVLTFHRWVNGTDEYADNLTGYRQYVVNHEVGHALGHGHERCPGPGQPAPVMQQQTLGLKGCAENSWPHPDPAAA